MNIPVHPNSGHISGIIDWAEAKILPFGTTLWGLENALCFMDSTGWQHYYDNPRHLEALFWRTFHGAVGAISETDKHPVHVARGPWACFCDMVLFGTTESESGPQGRMIPDSDI